MTPAVSCQQVSVALDGSPVLRGVATDVEPGEWLGLIGPNGAGKTTLLRVIAGTAAACGEIRLLGTPLQALTRRSLARLVAMVPQDPQTPSGMAALDYVLLGRTPHIPYFGSEGPADVRICLEALDRLDLRGMGGRSLGSLSGGERQRAVLARALAQQAPVLLLDEPTASLDVGHQQQVLELVDRLRREEGIAVLSAMHDLTLAGQYADRLVLLDRGEVVASGSPGQVLTTQLIARHYQAEVSVIADGAGLVVVPRRPSDSRRLASTAPTAQP
ncbi:MAG: ABC transporter ATP-binding protein [Actinomycetota bacterium]|nr:ABC transporter ATP-binding protein [Actinomycetota bacterium]